jgi:putative endonuclease
MTRATNAVGGYGERVAARLLIQAGMLVLDRNWRCGAGELDIVARDGPTIVVCEVKTRRGEECGSPADAVTRSKVRRLRGLAARWLADHPDVRGPVRFDVVSVWPRRRGAAAVEHLRGAF